MQTVQGSGSASLYPAAGITVKVFNAETWDFGYGKPFTEETGREILWPLELSHIQGFTVLGGEPFEPEKPAGCGRRALKEKQDPKGISAEGYLVLQRLSL